MPQVALKLNGRTYRFVCEPGEEAHFMTLAGYLQDKVEGVRQQFGKVGDERILAMAAILVTDELFEARAHAARPPAAASAQRMAAPRAPKAAKPVAIATAIPPLMQPSLATADEPPPAPSADTQS